MGGLSGSTSSEDVSWWAELLALPVGGGSLIQYTSRVRFMCPFVFSEFADLRSCDRIFTQTKVFRKTVYVNFFFGGGVLEILEGKVWAAKFSFYFSLEADHSCFHVTFGLGLWVAFVFMLLGSIPF